MVDEKEENNTQQEHIDKQLYRKKIIKKFHPSDHTIYYRADIESCTFICYKKQSIAGYNSFTKSLDNNIQKEYIKQQYGLQDRKKWNRNQVQDYEHAYYIQSFYNLHRLLAHQITRLKIDDKQLQQATCMFDSNLVKWLLQNYHPQHTHRQSITRSITTYHQPIQLQHHQHLPCCYKSIQDPTNRSAVAPFVMHKKTANHHAFTKPVDDRTQREPIVKEAFGFDNIFLKVDPDNGNEYWCVEYTNQTNETRTKYASIYQQEKREAWAHKCLVPFINKYKDTPTMQIIQESAAKLHTNMTHQLKDKHLLLKKYSIQSNKHDKVETTSHQQPKYPQDIYFDIYQQMDEKEHSMAKHRKRRKLKK